MTGRRVVLIGDECLNRIKYGLFNNRGMVVLESVPLALVRFTLLTAAETASAKSRYSAA
jgi:hypothetical protein